MKCSAGELHAVEARGACTTALVEAKVNEVALIALAYEAGAAHKLFAIGALMKFGHYSDEVFRCFHDNLNISTKI